MWRFKTLSIGDPERNQHKAIFHNSTDISDNGLSGIGYKVINCQKTS